MPWDWMGRKSSARSASFVFSSLLIEPFYKRIELRALRGGQNRANTVAALVAHLIPFRVPFGVFLRRKGPEIRAPLGMLLRVNRVEFRLLIRNDCIELLLLGRCKPQFAL